MIINHVYWLLFRIDAKKGKKNEEVNTIPRSERIIIEKKTR